MTFVGHVQAQFTTSSAAVSATNGAGGPTAVTVSDAAYFLDGQATTTPSLVAALQTALNASRPNGWTVTLSTTTGKVTIDCSSTPWSITWTSTTLRDLLGFTGNISSVSAAQTGSNQARGIWLPDSPIMMDGSHLSIPRVTDMRATESPTGVTIAHVGNVKYRHRNVRWGACPTAKVWQVSESTTYESLEQFLIDTQWGLGHTWFTPQSKCQIVMHSGDAVGNELVDGWYLNGVARMEDIVTRLDGNWDGLWSVALPSITSDG